MKKIKELMKLYDEPLPSLYLWDGHIPSARVEAIKILQQLGYEKCVRCDGIGCPDCDGLGWKRRAKR